MSTLYIFAAIAAVIGVFWLYNRSHVAPKPSPAPEPVPPLPVPVGDGWRENAPAFFPAQAIKGTLASVSLSGVTVKWDRSLATLRVGDVATATVFLNGQPAPIATKCQWAVDTQGLVQMQQSTTTPGLNRLLALKAGSLRIIALAGGGYSAIMPVTIAAAIPAPPPPPPPPVATGAPASTWARLRDSLSLLSTDFYYNWEKWTSGGPTAMETAYAKRYDIVISGNLARSQRMKTANPKLKHIPYTLQFTTLIDPPKPLAAPDTEHLSDRPMTAEFANADEPLPEAGELGRGVIRDYLRVHGDTIDAPLSKMSLRALTPVDLNAISTKYLADFDAWCISNAISAADAEAAWLHDATGKRIIPHIWDSPRNVVDPRSAVAVRYTLDRYRRICSVPGVDGAFMDELGQGGMIPLWKMATGTDTTALAAIQDAEIALLGKIAAQMATTEQQLIINTGSYKFPFDQACIEAAFGTHMEQENNPLAGGLTGGYASPGNPPPTWSFIDVLLKAGVLVNMVPPYQFGEYESQIGAPGTQKMDTTRGKYAEVCSALMVVTDPALLTLSIENGDWAKYTPTQNYVPILDATLGRAVEQRWRTPAPLAGSTVAPDQSHTWKRRFQNGLVLFQPIYHDPWERAKQDFGATIMITLPTDRAYYRVAPDGSIASAPSTTCNIRSPEGAVFVCTR